MTVSFEDERQASLVKHSLHSPKIRAHSHPSRCKKELGSVHHGVHRDPKL